LDVGLRFSFKPFDFREVSGEVPRSSLGAGFGWLPLYEDRLTQAGLDAFDRIGIHAGEDISRDRFQANFQILERSAIVARQIEGLVVSATFLPPFVSGESSAGKSQDALFGKELGKEGLRVSPHLLAIGPPRPMAKAGTRLVPASREWKSSFKVSTPMRRSQALWLSSVVRPPMMIGFPWPP
jgi:hypothetical protein